MKKNKDLFGDEVDKEKKSEKKKEIAKRIQSRKATLDRRNNDLNKRFDKLYNVDRIRYDDCIEKLAWEFYISTESVSRILKK